MAGWRGVREKRKGGGEKKERLVVSSIKTFFCLKLK